MTREQTEATVVNVIEVAILTAVDEMTALGVRVGNTNHLAGLVAVAGLNAACRLGGDTVKIAASLLQVASENNGVDPRRYLAEATRTSEVIDAEEVAAGAEVLAGKPLA